MAYYANYLRAIAACTNKQQKLMEGRLVISFRRKTQIIKHILDYENI